MHTFFNAHINTMFKPGDLVLTKMSGFPLWPAIVYPEESLPKVVSDQKPKTSEALPVKFFNDTTFYWSSPNGLKPLDSQKCETWLANKKNRNKSLRIAYEKAKSMPSLEQVLADTNVPTETPGEEFENGDYEEEDEEDEEDALHDAEPAGDESDHDEPPTKRAKKSPSQNGKTGKKSENGKKSANEKPATKKAQRKKSVTKKAAEPAGEGAANDKPVKEKKPRASKKKSAKDVLPEDLPEDVKLAAVKASRVTLQKTLFARSDFPNEDELKACSDVLNRLEYFSSKSCISVNILKNTKIHKVLKAMIKIDQLRETKYEFHSRCAKMLDQWRGVLAELCAEKSFESPNSGSPTRHDELSSLANTSTVKEEGETTKGNAVDGSMEQVPEPVKVEGVESESVGGEEGEATQPDKALDEKNKPINTRADEKVENEPINTGADDKVESEETKPKTDEKVESQETKPVIPQSSAVAEDRTEVESSEEKLDVEEAQNESTKQEPQTKEAQDESTKQEPKNKEAQDDSTEQNPENKEGQEDQQDDVKVQDESTSQLPDNKDIQEESSKQDDQQHQDDSTKKYGELVSTDTSVPFKDVPGNQEQATAEPILTQEKIEPQAAPSGPTN